MTATDSSTATTSRLYAYQFNLIELDAPESGFSPSVKAHLQCDEQHSALNKAGLPISVGGVEIAHYSEGADLTFAITVGFPGHKSVVHHQAKVGDWLVIDPKIAKPLGFILTNEEFQSLAASAQD